jgi:cobalt-zinc-cadmium resistance protein CzcA
MSRIVAFALKQRILVILLLAMSLAAGGVAFAYLNIEAYPDPVPPLIDVITLSPGQAAEDIERNITIPIEIQMAGLPHVTAIRTISFFGLSDTNIQFTYDFTYEEAEQRVLNRLGQLGPLPNGAQPQISAESPIGEIYRYRVAGSPGYSVADLKTLQDWVLERRFKAVPGVIDVTSWGGKDKTYDVVVNQQRLIDYGLSLPQVLQALNNSNTNIGAQTINIGPQSAVVRGVALIHSVEDLRNTMITSTNGLPVLLKDVASIEVGNLPRLGIAGLDNDDDIVQGIVMMRRGEESLPTIRRVEAEVQKINESGVLPPGVRIEKVYDRTDLIKVTTHTVLENMLMGVALIFLLQWAFLGDLRSAVIVATTIPFALAFAVMIMVLRGQSANLLSVGAIDFGLIVDATVVMVENIFRHLSEPKEQRFSGDVNLHRTQTVLGLRGKFAVIANSASQVNRAIFFSAALIIAGFVPLFTLGGVEGHIFGPMAQTYGYAIAGGLLATFLISPALSSLLLPEQMAHIETWLVQVLRRGYWPVIAFALANRVVTFGCAGLVLFLALVTAGFGLGSEFLPHLEEGNLWIRATMPASISLEEGDGYVNRMRRVIGGYPEVETVISQHGRPDDGTDATGFFNTEFFVPLKPFKTWPRGVDKERLTEQLKGQLEQEFPGVDFNFSQYIEDNVEEAASGVKGENSVKLFGNDLTVLEKTAEKIKTAMATVPGVTDLAVFSVLGQPTVRVDIDRAKAARFGLAPGDINATLQAAIGGQTAGNLYEDGSDRNFPINVRLASADRSNIDAIRHLSIGAPNPNGSGVIQIPLTEVADVNLTSGASFVYRENQERYIPIKFSVRGRDLGSAVEDAQKRISEQVRLPPGYRLEWVGEFGEFEEAIRRLAIVVPLSIFMIGVLLYVYFGSITDALLSASAIPMAIVGGIFALFLSGTAFSVSAAIGFVALFGIAAMDGIIILSYFNRMVDSGLDATTAILQTCKTQMRPVVMTCIVASVGLLPAALSSGIGSQVQKPLAIVVVGGMTAAPFLILTVLPLLIMTFSRRARRRVAATLAPQLAE